MALDVEVPDPPTLRGPQPHGDYEGVDDPDADEQGDDYRREEVAAALEEGAWADAFEEWAADASLSEAAVEAARERGLFERLDFYWDPAAEDVGHRAPSVPDGESFADADPDDVSEALDALGRTVAEVLENDYLVRDPEAEFGFFVEDTEEEADWETDGGRT